MLRENRTLKEVDLTTNQISEDGLWLFAQVMSSSNRTLTTLQLLCNAHTDTNILDVVDTALASNRDTDCLSFVCFAIIPPLSLDHFHSCMHTHNHYHHTTTQPQLTFMLGTVEEDATRTPVALLRGNTTVLRRIAEAALA